MGDFFKGIGNKLYRVLQLSVQKHFISFFFFFLDSKLVQPHTAAASDSGKKMKNKECFKYFLSLVVVWDLFLKTKCK